MKWQRGVPDKTGWWWVAHENVAHPEFGPVAEQVAYFKINASGNGSVLACHSYSGFMTPKRLGAKEFFRRYKIDFCAFIEEPE